MIEDPRARPSRGPQNVVVVGAGFTGLAAARDLARRGLRPTVLEAEPDPGGLAGSFRVGDGRLERFYHHWFTSDRHLMDLVAELGLSHQLITRPVGTGLYYANALFRLSSPLDVLTFSALSLPGRVRLGMLPLIALATRRWQDLDDIAASAWLRRACGEEVYRVVWEPLLRGKFGVHADTVSAAWFWSKLRLRGASRGRAGHEQLVYFRGGFAALADAIVRDIEAKGGRVVTGAPVTALAARDGRVTGVTAGGAHYPADAVIITTPLPEAAGLLSGLAPDDYIKRLRRIRYLANRCIILELDRSLSNLYWINVNDPEFPFVGVIEHTNFARAADYGGRHIVYLSRYCTQDDPFLSLSPQDAAAYTTGHLRRMFPSFDPGMILAVHSWQTRSAQPIVETGYAKLVPSHETPLAGVFLATMAQVYPEDRGTNYAIRDGYKVAGLVVSDLAAV
ncbi:MAG: NAD(P)/FAD-dependent oxidoreductase [Xanthobacteraceae bacterium]|nr:NAD(P)/FAD-dependent oxidoreductase [Xanthobacteraceae bacterium]